MSWDFKFFNNKDDVCVEVFVKMLEMGGKSMDKSKRKWQSHILIANLAFE